MNAAARRPAAWQRALGLLGAVFLGAVLLFAVWAKVLDPAAFATAIRTEGLDFLLPAAAVAILALALETGLGAALVLGIRRAWVLWPTAALVAFFLFLTGRGYWRYLHGEAPADAGCGCFGNLVQRTPAEAFWQDLLLMVPALLLAFVGRRAAGAFPRTRTALAAALTAGVALLAWKAPELPLDDLATRLKPGARAFAFCAGGDDDPVCLDTILPELAEGEHLVILSGLDEPPFVAAVEALNEHHWSGRPPAVWVLSAADDETLFAFRFGSAPAFEIRETPAPLLRPLYRTLPRAFLARDGVVTETYRGLPPRFAAAAETPSTASR